VEVIFTPTAPMDRGTWHLYQPPPVTEERLMQVFRDFTLTSRSSAVEHLLGTKTRLRTLRSHARIVRGRC
jgi:hypothetical protein